MPLNFLVGPLSKLLPSSRQIGVLGSLGKTSTVLAIKSVLGGQSKSEVVEFELPIKKLKSEVLVVTNVFDLQNEHQSHVLADEYANIAAQVPKTGAVILNWDDTESRKLATHTPAEVIFYGTEPKNCHIWAGNIHLSQNRVSFELNYGVERVEVKTNFLSVHQIYSLLAATAVGLCQGLRLTLIKSALENVMPLEHKLEFLPGFEGSIIIDDSSDGVIATTEAAIETLNNFTARRRIVVFGQMQSLGKAGDKLYRRIAEKIYQEKTDLVLIGSGDCEEIAKELLELGFISQRLRSGLTNPQIVSELLQILAKGDVVLVKGAKEVRLDEVVSKICKK